MEARVGIEPTYKGFADLSLTTWVPRPTSQLSFPGGKSPRPPKSSGQQRKKLTLRGWASGKSLEHDPYSLNRLAQIRVLLRLNYTVKPG